MNNHMTHVGSATLRVVVSVTTVCSFQNTHGTQDVAVLVPPARCAGAGSVDRVAGGAVGTLTCLVAVQPPGATGAGDGTVHTLPAWTETHVVTRFRGRSYLILINSDLNQRKKTCGILIVTF